MLNAQRSTLNAQRSTLNAPYLAFLLFSLVPAERIRGHEAEPPALDPQTIPIATVTTQVGRKNEKADILVIDSGIHQSGTKDNVSFENETEIDFAAQK